MGQDITRDHKHSDLLMSFELFYLGSAFWCDPGVGVRPDRHLLNSLGVVAREYYKWHKYDCL
jgi:hypothetical protein